MSEIVRDDAARPDPSAAPDDEAEASRSAAIRLREVTKRFGRRAVLDGASLEVEAGSMTAITGPSGAGKSTTLHLCAALDTVDSGSIVVAGHELRHPRHASRFRRETVAIVFQLHNLIARLTAVQNVGIAMYGTGVGRKERARRARELLDQVGLADLADSYPPSMSGGERQRVAVARALANRPEVLLADEPTGSLDHESAAVVIQVLRDLAVGGTTVLAVTHDDRLLADTDRVVRLADGGFRDLASG